MDFRKRPPEVGQGFGTRKYVRRTDQIERKNLQRAQVEKKEHSTASSLPPVAGIITSLSNTRPYLSSFELWQNPSLSPEDEKQFNELVLPRAEVIHKLRHYYQQPTTMFGEDDNARLLRFKDLLKSGRPHADPYTDENRIDLPLDLVDFKRSDKNAFLRRDNKSKRKGVDGMDDSLGARNGSNVGTSDKIPDLELDADLEYMKNHFDTLCVEDKILVFFRQLLIEWERELKKRPESEKRTDKGRSNVATLEQCTQNLAPLVMMCRKKMLSPDMRQALLSIVTNCLQKDYLAAMDQYIKLALYNAPCPIGITMVDIHEHGGREKVSTNAIAQTPTAEITRKVLQSMKRLMTLCQRRYPTVLSKPVECNGFSNGNGPQPLLQQEVLTMGNHIAGERMRGVVSVNSSSLNNGSVL